MQLPHQQVPKKYLSFTNINMKQDLVIRTSDPIEYDTPYSYRLGDRVIYSSDKIMNQDAKHLFDLPS